MKLGKGLLPKETFTIVKNAIQKLGEDTWASQHSHGFDKTGMELRKIAPCFGRDAMSFVCTTHSRKSLHAFA
eukprot:6492278-Amphidinium_carterae.1